MKRILENIEAIRKEKGIKQAVIAEMLEINQSSYSMFIRRESDIRWSRLSQICDLFEMDVVDVITYPIKYVPAADQCESCREKDEVIRNLNDYIEVLKKRK